MLDAFNLVNLPFKIYKYRFEINQNYASSKPAQYTKLKYTRSVLFMNV